MLKIRILRAGMMPNNFMKNQFFFKKNEVFEDFLSALLN